MRKPYSRAMRFGAAFVTVGLLSALLPLISVAGSSLPRAITAATAVGQVTIYSGDISNPIGIAAGPDGALWFTNQTNDSIGRITTTGAVTNYTGSGISGPHGIAARTRRRPVVHQLRAATRSGGSPPPGRSPTSPAPASLPGRDRGRARRRPVVHQLAATARSGGSPPPGRSPTTPAPGISGPAGITAGPDGALWFTNNYCNNSIGRITTTGIVTNYTGIGISNPAGIAAGPDGALWFTNDAWSNSIGRITTAGTVTNYTGTGITCPDVDRGRTRRRPVVHQLGQRLDRAHHHHRDRHQLHRLQASATRPGSPPDPTAPCGSPTPQQLDRADRCLCSHTKDRAWRGDDYRGQFPHTDAQHSGLIVRAEPVAGHRALDHRERHGHSTERLRRVVRDCDVRAG